MHIEALELVHPMESFMDIKFHTASAKLLTWQGQREKGVFSSDEREKFHPHDTQHA